MAVCQMASAFKNLNNEEYSCFNGNDVWLFWMYIQ